MSDEDTNDKASTKAVASEPTTQFKTSVEVILPSTGKKFIVHKLKAGKFYEAQKVYLNWLQVLQSLLVDSSIDLKTVVDKENNPDIAKIKKQLGSGAGIDLDKVQDVSGGAAKLKSELIGLCVGRPLEDIDKDFYPEDLNILFEASVSINDFMENIKKSVAPMGGLGA